MLRIIGIMFCIMTVTSCGHTPVPASTTDDSQRLSVAISALSSSINQQEAIATSKLLLSATSELVQEYEMVSPPRYHNLLVNLGLRERGLCCHWAEDLHARLLKIGAESIEVDLVVASHGSRLREHSSLVLHATDSTWQQGLVFDPWRKAGQPYWIHVDRDTYPWRLHPLTGKWHQLRCK